MILETKSHSLKVTLTEENGKIILKTDIFPYLKYFRDSIITSDILGCAFEPNQRFENPDGSAIVFDEDYFGLRRELSTLP